MNSKQYAEAFQQYRSALAEAVRWNNPNYTHNAITRGRHKRVMQARSALMDAIPAAVEATGPNVADYVAGLRPTTADAVAVADFEWRQAVELMDSGRSLEQVIQSASPARLRAIAAHIETLPEALKSPDAEGVIAEVKSRVFDRLVDSPDADAAKVAEAHRTASASNAWREFLTGALEGEATLGQQTAVAKADPEGFAALDRSEYVADDVDTDMRVKALDARILGRG